MHAFLPAALCSAQQGNFMNTIKSQGRAVIKVHGAHPDQIIPTGCSYEKPGITKLALQIFKTTAVNAIISAGPPISDVITEG